MRIGKQGKKGRVVVWLLVEGEMEAPSVMFLYFTFQSRTSRWSNRDGSRIGSNPSISPEVPTAKGTYQNYSLLTEPSAALQFGLLGPEREHPDVS